MKNSNKLNSVCVRTSTVKLGHTLYETLSAIVGDKELFLLPKTSETLSSPVAIILKNGDVQSYFKFKCNPNCKPHKQLKIAAIKAGLISNKKASLIMTEVGLNQTAPIYIPKHVLEDINNQCPEKNPETIQNEKEFYSYLVELFQYAVSYLLRNWPKLTTEDREDIIHDTYATIITKGWKSNNKKHIKRYLRLKIKNEAHSRHRKETTIMRGGVPVNEDECFDWSFDYQKTTEQKKKRQVRATHMDISNIQMLITDPYPNPAEAAQDHEELVMAKENADLNNQRQKIILQLLTSQNRNLEPKILYDLMSETERTLFYPNKDITNLTQDEIDAEARKAISRSKYLLLAILRTIRE